MSFLNPQQPQIQMDLPTLESMIPQLYLNPSPSPQTTQYANVVKTTILSNLDTAPVLLSYLTQTKSTHLQFFLIDLLIQVTSSYEKLSMQTKNGFRQSIATFISSTALSITGVGFVANKLSLFIITWLKYDYPENYGSFFNDLIQLIIKSSDNVEKMKLINFLFDLLSIFDDELIKFRHTYTEFEAQRANIIKDYLRLNVMNDIIFVLNQVLSNANYIDSALVLKSIKVVSQLIDWNVLTLFGDIIQKITPMLNNKTFRISSLETINALMKKGMSIVDKVNIITLLNVKQIIESMFSDINCADTISEIVLNIAEASMQGVGCDVNNGGKAIKNFTSLNADALSLIAYCLNISNAMIVKKMYKQCTIVSQFITKFVYFIKTTQMSTSAMINNTEIRASLTTLCDSIEKSLLIPRDEYGDIVSDAFDIDKVSDDDYFAYRKDFSAIMTSLFCVSCLKGKIIDDIAQIASSNSNDVYCVEHLLLMINVIQSGITNEDVSSGKINAIMSILFSNVFFNFNSHFVAFEYFDTVVKYINLYIENKDAVNAMLSNFLSKNGILISNFATGAKITILFDRFIEKAKKNFNDEKLISLSNKIYEYISLIISSKNFNLIAQYETLFKTASQVISCITAETAMIGQYENLLKLILSIFSVYGTDDATFVTVTKCMTSFLTVFSSDVNNINIKTLFRNFFNVYINDYYSKTNTKNQKIIYAMITVLQRLIICLNSDALSYIDFFFGTQSANITHDTFIDISRLFINAINSLKISSYTLIKKYYSNLHLFASQIEIPLSDISDADKNTLSILASYFKLFNCLSSMDAIDLFINRSEAAFDIIDIVRFANYVNGKVKDVSIIKINLRSIANVLEFLGKNKYRDKFISTVAEVLNGTLTLNEEVIVDVARVHVKIAEFDDGKVYIEYMKTISSEENVIRELIAVLRNEKIKGGKISEATNKGIKWVRECYYKKRGLI